MSEVFLGLYTMGAMNLLADRPFSTKDRFGREMLDPFVGFSDINQHEFAPAPNLPQYDRLEIVTAVYQYVYTRTTGTNAGYTADYVTPGNANSLVYRMYNEGTAVFALYPWTSSDPFYIPYGTSQIPFPGTALTVPYYGNFGAGSPGINGNGRYLTYTKYILTAKLYKTVNDDPCYLDLVTGYALDTRSIPDNPAIIPTTSKTVELRYYQRNHLELIPGLTSICWRVYQCELVEGMPIQLPITRCVLGTLYCSDIDISTMISALPTVPTKYSWVDLLPTRIAPLFAGWKQLQIANSPSRGQVLEYVVIRKLAANNNIWNNADLSQNVDINVATTHPMFTIDNQRAYDWHIKPQADGSYGNLIMDSPRTIEMHAALNAGNYLQEVPEVIGTGTPEDPQIPATHKLDYYIKNSKATGTDSPKVTAIWKALGGDKYGTNDIDSKKDRVTNLGFLVERIAKVLGIRLNANGMINQKLEKTTNRRLHIEGSAQNDEQDYNPNCFGDGGLLVRYLPNKFSPSGTVPGGYRKIKDIPQLLAELHEQANAAMGYQEGTAIEINVDGKTYRYPNQLALMTEIFVTMKQSAVYSKGAFFSSVVGEQSIKEVMSGLGLRTVDKYLEFKVAGKMVKLYYKGVSASQSIRRKMSAVATNIGTILGNIT